MYFSGNWYEDNFIMTNILDTLEFYSGTDRKKLLRKDGIKHPKDGGSMLYGTTWRGYLSPSQTRTKAPYKGLYYTKAHDLYPDLEFVLREFGDLYFKDFNWEQVQLNKNYKVGRHTDSKNINESVLCCFGDYTGGNTIIEYENKKVSVDAREKPIKFNGSKYYHYVEDFEGTRYSLVFFNNNKKIKVKGV